MAKGKGIPKALYLVGLVGLALISGCRTCQRPSRMNVEVETTYRHRDGSVTVKIGKEF
jgi:hypothetical protein